MTIHAYSPPLERMGAYAVDENGLLVREPLDYTEELRPFVETMLNKRIVAKIVVERTVSWDHRKLGLPSTRPA